METIPFVFYGKQEHICLNIEQSLWLKMQTPEKDIPMFAVLPRNIITYFKYIYITFT